MLNNIVIQNIHYIVFMGGNVDNEIYSIYNNIYKNIISYPDLDATLNHALAVINTVTNVQPNTIINEKIELLMNGILTCFGFFIEDAFENKHFDDSVYKTLFHRMVSNLSTYLPKQTITSISIRINEMYDELCRNDFLSESDRLSKRKDCFTLLGHDILTHLHPHPLRANTNIFDFDF